MKTKPLTIKVAALTVSSFFLSYIAGSLSDTNHSAFFPLAIAEKYNQEGESQIETFEITKNIELKNLSKIYIETVATDIAVESTKNDKIILQLKGQYPVAKVASGKLIRIETNKGKLSVILDEETEGSSSWPIHWNFKGEGKITLLIPEKIKNLEILSVSGDIKTKDGNFEALVVKNISGDFHGDNLYARLLQVNTVSGDVTSDGHVDKIISKSVSGDFKIKSALDSASLELRTTSGDTALYYKSQPNAKIDFSSVSGSVKISKNLRKTKPQSGNQNDDDTEYDSEEFSKEFHLGEGKGLIKASSISGDLSIGIY